MNQKTILQIKNELLAQQKNIFLFQTQNAKVEIEQEVSKDLIDRSDAEEGWFTKERMSQHWKVEMAQIKTALHKFEDGSFGICEECDADIPLKRLKVRPDAVLCLNCQEVFEHEARTSLSRTAIRA